MPKKVGPAQPSSSRDDPFPSATQDTQRSPPPALLPKDRAVVLPAVPDEEHQVPELQSVSMSLSRGEEAESSVMPRVRACLRACSGLLGCQCFTTEEAQLVREIEVQPDASKKNARKTHYLSNLITRVQCFLMPTSISIEERFPLEAKAMNKILGIRVQFKNEKCDRLCYRCEDCGVCPHMYTCSCSNFYKYKGTMWCAHIHTMHTLTEDRFKEKVCLYIQTDIRYMMIRHTRAFIRGEDFMRPTTENIFEEAVDNFEGFSKYKVIQLKNVENNCTCLVVDKCIKCAGCRCRYSCTCPDYIFDRQVCQHVHSVAMIRRRISFINWITPPLEFSHTLIATQDRNKKYYVQLEHEMSFYLRLENIVKQEDLPPADLCVDNIVEFSSKEVLNVRNVGSDSEESSDSDESSKQEYNKNSWWIIYRKVGSCSTEEECRVRLHFPNTKKCLCKRQPFPDDNNCARCGICFRHYMCNCPLDVTIICRHVHAVHRMLNNIQETEEEAEQYIKELLPVPAILANLPDDYIRERWACRFGKDDAPPAAKQRKKMDTLPPPTD